MTSRRSRFPIAATAALALAGAAIGTAAHARSGADVQWSVTVGTPAIPWPAPVLALPVPGAVVVAPVPRVVYVPERPVIHDPYHPPRPNHRGRHGYAEPTHWDIDGDGIPNRHDRLYNPVWDRNGNGVPDRREYRYGPHGDRDRDGIPNRYDRHDDRWDRGDVRRDPRDDDRREWRGPPGR